MSVTNNGQIAQAQFRLNMSSIYLDFVLTLPLCDLVAW